MNCDFFTRSYQSKEYIDIITELQHVPALIEIDDPPEETEPDCEAAEEIEADHAPPALTAETVERLSTPAWPGREIRTLRAG